MQYIQKLCIYLIFSILSNYWLPLLALDDTFDDFDSCLVDLELTELLRLQKSMDRLNERHELRHKHYLQEMYGNSTRIEAKTIDKDERQLNAVADDDYCKTSACNKGRTMALHERGHTVETEYHPWHSLEEEKPSKLQILFQISVTSLAFLSFGGYLLCLIVQAIKSKGTTYIHPVSTNATTTANGGLKRIKIFRRSRRYLPSLNDSFYAYYYQTAMPAATGI